MDPVSILLSLAQFAPSLIKWATGSDKAEQVATVALNTVKGITGRDDLDGAMEALRTNPEYALKFQTAMLNRDSEFEKLYVEDKANARARDVALSATPHGNVRANWLCGIAILIVIAILYVVITIPTINEFAKGVITTILGVFINQITNIYNFEFGTTRRGREQSDALAFTNPLKKWMSKG